jgi:hypothetical protein
MSDYSINSISSVRPADAGTVPSRAAPGGPVEVATPKFTVPGAPEAVTDQVGAPAGDPASRKLPAQISPDSPAARLAAQTAQAAQEKVDTKPSLPITNSDNVTIRFRVDHKTNNVTVFIVDRVSKRVLRSIPPEEVGKLQAGDLFELTG